MQVQIKTPPLLGSSCFGPSRHALLPYLALKRVQQLPSLVQHLARNVDAALTDALNTLPPLDGLLQPNNRKKTYVRPLQL